MPQSAGLIFTNDAGAGSGTSTYVIDTLPDYTFAPTNNTGFSSTVSNNPNNNNFANSDLPQYGAKYLPIKDLVFIQDRSKWINGKTTYQVIFYENFPQIVCYAFGNIQLNYNNGQASILFKSVGDGISVNGVIRQVAFLIQPTTAATATAQVVVDGSNQSTAIDFSSAATPTPPTPYANAFNAYLHNTTMESYNIHDIRLTANQASTLNIGGIIVYFQNAGGSIDQFPGTTYVNKNKLTTTTGATMSVPNFGSSLGGNFLVYKTQLAGYSISALSATTIASTASGASGTNLLSFATGTGASFIAGYGVIVTQGSSYFLSSIVSMSTDTATLGNTIGFGITAGSPAYTAWKAGSTLGINASLMMLYKTIDFTRLPPNRGFSQALYDTQGLYTLYGNNIGMTYIDGNQCALFLGASGFMQVDGYFSAAEFESLGTAIFSATLSVNGMASWSFQGGQTGTVKRTVFTDAGPGWNSFNMGVGPSMGIVGIQRINLYQRNRDFGISYGHLVDFDQCQAYTNRSAVNATMMALGGIRRIYADQLYFKTSWSRGQTWSVPGGVYYQGTSTNGSLTFQYYGSHFGIIGTVNTGSTITLDGNGVGMTFNIMNSVATLGFHTINYTGGTAQIAAIDFYNPLGISHVDAPITPISLSPQLNLLPPSFTIYRGGTGFYTGPNNRLPLYIKVRMVGGGGGGGDQTSGGTFGTGTFFGSSLLFAGGGGGGGSGGNLPGNGGTFIVNGIFSAFGITGSMGGGGEQTSNGVATGGHGGNSPFGGAGGALQASNGIAAAPNTGSGGGGGDQVNSYAGNGGAAGAYIEAIIPIQSASVSFPYVVGIGGQGSTANSGGGNGADGIIIIEEFYQ